MKRKTLLLGMGVIVFGIFAYIGAYDYVYEKPGAELREPISLQRSMSTADAEISAGPLEYYVARLEEGMLHIYKMPENMIYDSVKLSSLQFSEEEYRRLTEGMIFENLTEVFEFLENSMS